MERLLFVPFKLYLVLQNMLREKTSFAVKYFTGLFIDNELLVVLILKMLLKTHYFFGLFL